MRSNTLKQTIFDLRRPLVIASVLLGISAALFVFSYVYFQRLDKQNESTQEAYRSIRKGISVAKSDIETGRKYASIYASLGLSGTSDDFEKQRALDHLELALSSNLVIPKSYALAGREAMKTPEFLGLEKHEVSRHTVMIEMQLAHEVRLLNLIEKMTQPNPGGITTIEACEMTSGKNEARGQDKSDGKETNITALNARCQLNWYRFASKAAPINNGLGNPAGSLAVSTTATSFGSSAGGK
jgi:hypothetical protein